MQMAIDVAGFTPGRGRPAAPGDGVEALAGADGSDARPAARRAWPSAASPATIAEEIVHKLEAFADFGFPESHSVSFAYLVYASSWIKLHYPAEFACRAAQRAADGLLLAAHHRARRPPPRRGGARARPQRVLAGATLEPHPPHGVRVTYSRTGVR